MGWRRRALAGRYVDRRRLLRLMMVLAICGTLLLCCAGAMRLKPLLKRMAESRVSNIVTGIVCDAVDEAVTEGDIQYAELVTFEKDCDGHITALYSNMAAFNRLQSDILDVVVCKIGETKPQELSIPVGSLTGSALLAGRGPRIRVRMESMGSSTARFENEFLAAGINQTKHQIVLHVDVFVSILLPGITTATKVSNAVTVAETVIVGAVPQTYTYFSSEPKALEDDMKDYILNNG